MASFKSRIQRVRDNVSIIELVNKFGFNVKPTKTPVQIRCPLPDHDDNHPSARLFPDSNKIRCFVCLFHGDVVDLTAKVLGCNSMEAVGWLEEQFDLQDKAIGVSSKLWGTAVMERFLEDDIENAVLNRLYKLREKLHPSTLYIYWIWSDHLWELYDSNYFELKVWKVYSMKVIDRMIEPLVGKIDRDFLKESVHCASALKKIKFFGSL